MDIGAAGFRYFEQYRYGVENLPVPRGGGSSPFHPSFAEHLEEARSVQEAGTRDAKALALEDPPRSGKSVPGKPVIDKTSKLFEQCRELETFLVKNLLTGMRNTVQKGSLIEEGLAGKFYEDMLWDEYAKDFTRNAGFGLAEQAYLELTGQRGLLRGSPADEEFAALRA
jgi:flagellar protein FlgJ